MGAQKWGHVTIATRAPQDDQEEKEHGKKRGYIILESLVEQEPLLESRKAISGWTHNATKGGNQKLVAGKVDTEVGPGGNCSEGLTGTHPQEAIAGKTRSNKGMHAAKAAKVDGAEPEEI